MHATVATVDVLVAVAAAKRACIFAARVTIVLVAYFFVVLDAAAAVVVASVCKMRLAAAPAAVFVARTFRDILGIVVFVENPHLAAAAVVRRALVLPLL